MLDLAWYGSPSAIAVLDTDLRYVQVNAAMAELGGTPANDHAGRTPSEVMPRFGDAVEAMLQQVQETGEAIANVPISAPAPDVEGGWRYWLVSFHPVRAESGQLVFLGMIAVDMTREILSEEALRDSERRFRLLAEQASDLVARHAPDGTYLYASPSFERVLGYAPADLVGRSPFDLIEPEDREEVTRAVMSALGGEQVTFTYRARRRDGTLRWLEATTQSVLDEDGSVVEMQSATRDVTRRKEIELALRDSQAQLALAFEAGKLGMWDFDVRTGRSSYSGLETALFGLSEDTAEFTTDLFYSRVHPEDVPRVRAAIHAALAHGGEYTDEYRVVHDGGQVRWLRAVGSVTLDADGRAARMTGVHYDITDRRAAEAEVKELNTTLEQRVRERTRRVQELHAELSAFATSVSRDIQEPLRRIGGFLKLLEKRLGDDIDPRTSEYLRYIQADGSRVGRLVEDLQSFARFGREELRLAEVPLGGLVKQVRSDLDAFTRGRRIEWTVPELPSVRGDAMLLRQAVAALLDNAIKFTRLRDVAHIEVGARQEGREIVVWVRDDGEGFPPQESARLFNVFQRLHDDRFIGAGVGLANVRRIVTRHGGRVWAEGEEGRGATFYFTLPVD
ncbi:PAS domain-containing protein [Deinococcus pimensis]|uniref:PAS domain-containing protein n=1 Tax=Deinococcus pimensis TaxID=309888 RepID=UPI00048059A7|nr:PAS domain-containing protein [Deinococcus pimensis]